MYFAYRLWLTFGGILFLTLLLPLAFLGGDGEAAGYLIILSNFIFLVSLVLTSLIFVVRYKSIAVFMLNILILLIYLGITTQFEFKNSFLPPKFIFESLYDFVSFFKGDLRVYLICGVFLLFEMILLGALIWINEVMGSRRKPRGLVGRKTGTYFTR